MSGSIWLSECDPDELRAQSPHVLCGKGRAHDGHGWRGTTVEFGGACQVTRTYWCDGTSDPNAVTSDESPSPHRRAR